MKFLSALGYTALGGFIAFVVTSMYETHWRIENYPLGFPKRVTVVQVVDRTAKSADQVQVYVMTTQNLPRLWRKYYPQHVDIRACQVETRGRLLMPDLSKCPHVTPFN